MDVNVESGCGPVSILVVTAGGPRGQNRALTLQLHVGKWEDPRDRRR